MENAIESMAQDYALANAFAPIERARSNGHCRHLAKTEKDDLEMRIESALAEAFEEGASAMAKLINLTKR